jgi:tetratricopeptide (TPR) repeat protein
LYYIPARRGLLDLKYVKITRSGNYTDADVQSLVAAYQEFINNYGMSRSESGDVVLRLAEVKGLYGGKMAEAIDLLEKFVQSTGVKSLIAKAKLQLGDYYLLDGNIWESTLRYSQVEKMYKDDPLGHEAKFRNARLSFYNGEFEWANAQLDVLKGSTSELIANDALQLSLLIQENSGWDSTELPLHKYAEAELLVYKNQFAQAEAKLDSIATLSPGNTLEDEILMLRAQIAVKKHDYEKALDYYGKVIKEYGTDILADEALFKAAQLCDYTVNKPEQAKSLYEKIILDYKGSVYAMEAGRRYRVLRGDVLPQ